jgi:hypothetical protein
MNWQWISRFGSIPLTRPAISLPLSDFLTRIPPPQPSCIGADIGVEGPVAGWLQGKKTTNKSLCQVLLVLSGTLLSPPYCFESVNHCSRTDSSSGSRQDRSPPSSKTGWAFCFLDSSLIGRKSESRNPGCHRNPDPTAHADQAHKADQGEKR